MDPLSEDDVNDHLKEDCGNSDKHSPEIEEEVQNEVTDTRNEPVPSASNKRVGFHRTGRAGLRGGRGHVPGNFALLNLCHFEILQ